MAVSFPNRVWEGPDDDGLWVSRPVEESDRHRRDIIAEMLHAEPERRNRLAKQLAT